MSTGARSPEELETLLEDAFVLDDAAALARLFEPTAVLVVAGEGARRAHGPAEIARLARELSAGGHVYLAEPRRVVQAHGSAVVVGVDALHVVRRHPARAWRYALSVLSSTSRPKEQPMHAMIVTMTLDPARGEDVARHFRDDVVPWATSRQGFVTGHWLRGADGARGMGVVVFDSAEAAGAATAGPLGAPPDGARAWNIDGVEVFEQIVSA